MPPPSSLMEAFMSSITKLKLQVGDEPARLLNRSDVAALRKYCKCYASEYETGPNQPHILQAEWLAEVLSVILAEMDEHPRPPG